MPDAPGLELIAQDLNEAAEGSVLGTYHEHGQACLIVALACVLDSKHRRSHMSIVCSIAVVIAFMLAIVVSFDHPFTGPIAVSDRPIRAFIATPSIP